MDIKQWRTEEPGGLQSMGRHRVGHDLATEQQQVIKKIENSFFLLIYSPFPASHNVDLLEETGEGEEFLLPPT